MFSLITEISIGLIIGIVAGALSLILIIWVLIASIKTYNKLVALSERVDNAWSQIDVQLKQRYDLIPNLVEVVKGFATHEKETLENVARARASVGSAKTPEEMIEANNSLGNALSRLLIVSEKYPELKANQNFLNLESKLTSLERQIAITRQFYNDTALKYNEYSRRFPSNIYARLFRFKKQPYFEVNNDVEREAPRFKF